MPRRMGPPASFGVDPTPLTTRVIGVLFGVYVVQLLAENWLGLPVTGALAWSPWRSGLFRPWQPLTFWLLSGPAPLSALISWVVLFFFLPPTERTLGRRGTLRFTLFTVAFTAVAGLLLDLVGAVAGGSPVLGIEGLLAAMIVVFGLAHPRATILLFFVIPVQAAWIAWGSGVLALLNFLAGRSLGAAVILAGWIAGWLWMELLRRGGLRRVLLRRKQARIKKKLSRFEVIDGGRGPDGGPWVH